MDAQFWLDRWRSGKTGFNQTRPMPLLAKYWPSLDVPRGARVLVPLCGKTIDMTWLASQGHHVLGVELSPLAIEQFFDENQLAPSRGASSAGTLYRAGNIEILCGDIFAMTRDDLAGCAGAYDRAALVALPPPMRERYARHVYGQLPAGCRTLLVTIEYDQREMQGPPFAVLETEVRALYQPCAEVVTLDRRDILAKDPALAARGVTKLDTVVYALRSM